MINKEIIIQGEKVYLKTLHEDDVSDEYVAWLNDKKINQYLETKKASKDGLRKYVREKYDNNNCIFLGIFFKENNKHIGNIKLEPIDLENKSATVGIMLGDKNYWGKGISTETLKLFLSWIFNNLSIHEVNLGVNSDNKAAIRVYEKVGFKFKKDLNARFFMSIER